MEAAGFLSPGEVEALVREEAQGELEPREEEEVGEVDQAQDLQLPHSCQPRHDILTPPNARYLNCHPTQHLTPSLNHPDSH